MWLEVKMLMSVIAMIFIGIVTAFNFGISLIFAFLLLLAVGLIVIGDMLIGYQIWRNDLKPQMDYTPPGKETCILITLTKNFRIFNTVKGPEGERRFRFNGRNASVINKGDFQVRLKNGNSAFIAHESHDGNINLFEAKYAEKLNKEFETDSIKDIHAMAVAEVDRLAR